MAEGGVGPRLKGRATADFIEKMHRYHEGKTVGPLTSMMTPSAEKLTAQDIQDMAAYVNSLK